MTDKSSGKVRTDMEQENKVWMLRVEDMKKYYPVKGGIITHTTGYVKAVDGVSFSIEKGETLGLVGESGSGKSTVGRQLVGLEKPTAGTIYYQGRNLAEIEKDKREMQKIRTKLQMVFQDPYSYSIPGNIFMRSFPNRCCITGYRRRKAYSRTSRDC